MFKNKLSVPQFHLYTIQIDRICFFVPKSQTWPGGFLSVFFGSIVQVDKVKVKVDSVTISLFVYFHLM